MGCLLLGKGQLREEVVLREAVLWVEGKLFH